MPFIASQLSLQRAFEQLQANAQTQKIYLTTWAAKLTGTITALDAVEWTASLNRHIAAFDEAAAVPGLAAYAQQQFGSASYDVVAEFNAMRASLVAVRSWLQSNIPANSVTVSSGALVGASYAPAATAPLRTLVLSAAASIA